MHGEHTGFDACQRGREIGGGVERQTVGPDWRGGKEHRSILPGHEVFTQALVKLSGGRGGNFLRHFPALDRVARRAGAAQVRGRTGRLGQQLPMGGALGNVHASIERLQRDALESASEQFFIEGNALQLGLYGAAPGRDRSGQGLILGRGG